MAQILKGTNYATGQQVTADNLNNHVDNATLLPGAILDQPNAVSISGADTILLQQGGALREASIAQVTSTVSGFLKLDGTTSMQAPLLLNTTTQTPVALNQAVSYGYVQALAIPGGTAALDGLVPKTGNVTITGSMTMAAPAFISQAVDGPSPNALARMGWVTQQLGSLTAQSVFAAHTATINAHNVTATLLGVGAYENVLPANLQISTATQAALNAKLNLTGGTLTGALGLPAADPVAPDEATRKAYVDTRDNLKLNLTGGTITGPVNFTSSAVLSLTADVQTAATSAITRSQFEALPQAQRTRIVASATFSTSNTTTNALSETEFIPVTIERVGGASFLYVNYSSVANANPEYVNASRPFFQTGQYVCFKGQAGVQAGLYKIAANNLSTKVFTCDPAYASPTPPTSAIAALTPAQLSCVYKDVNANKSDGMNVKSVYVDMNALSKYYVNYIRDPNGSGTNTGTTAIKTAVAQGNAASNATSGNCCVMRDVGRTTNVITNNNSEGVGASQMGCHIGFMSTGTAGVSTNYVYEAAFAISQRE